MLQSDIALTCRALVRLGARPIASFDEGSAEAEAAGALYETVRDGLLSCYPWNFASAEAELAELADPPLADFARAFALPADFLRALSAGAGPGKPGAGASGPGLDYRIKGQALCCDASAVVLSYVFRPAEAEFPPFFTQALIARLAADLCLPLTESASRAELLARLADVELTRARSIDAQQDAPPRFEAFSLVDVRR
jgi:hypothetical protein